MDLADGEDQVRVGRVNRSEEPRRCRGLLNEVPGHSVNPRWMCLRPRKEVRSLAWAVRECLPTRLHGVGGAERALVRVAKVRPLPIVGLIVRHHVFWPLIALASLCLVLAGASFAGALFSGPLPQLPRRFATYAPGGTDKLGVSEPEISYYYTGTTAFGRAISLSWSSDRGFLIATILFGAVGVAIYGLASRVR